MENINFVAIDFETAKSPGYACQLGLVVVRKGLIVEEKCWLIQPPENKYDRNTIQIHGIYPSDTKDSPTFGDLWPEIKPYLEYQTVVSHNSSFDLEVLSRGLNYYKITPVKFLSSVCTCNLMDRISLDKACSLYNVELENHHNALSDARACAKVFIEYLRDCEDLKWQTYIEEKETFPPVYPKPYSENREKSASMFPNYEIHKPIPKEFLIKDLSQSDQESPLYNKKLVITGEFPIDREVLAAIASKKMGADINTSISSKTNFVFAGLNPGPSKMQKVKELQEKGFDIKVCDSEETMRLINPYQIV